MNKIAVEGGVLSILIGDTNMKDVLSVSKADLNSLIERVKGIERAKPITSSAYGRKMCPTRHGCQGATDCNYSYGSYPG